MPTTSGEFDTTICQIPRIPPPTPGVGHEIDKCIRTVKTVALTLPVHIYVKHHARYHVSPCGNLNIIFSLNEFSLSKSLLVALLNSELGSFCY